MGLLVAVFRVSYLRPIILPASSHRDSMIESVSGRAITVRPIMFGKDCPSNDHIKAAQIAHHYICRLSTSTQRERVSLYASLINLLLLVVNLKSFRIRCRSVGYLKGFHSTIRSTVHSTVHSTRFHSANLFTSFETIFFFELVKFPKVSKKNRLELQVFYEIDLLSSGARSPSLLENI